MIYKTILSLLLSSIHIVAQLPSQITVHHRTVHVILSDKTEKNCKKDDAIGCFHWLESTIEINSHLSQLHAREVFKHELKHAVILFWHVDCGDVAIAGTQWPEDKELDHWGLDDTYQPFDYEAVVKSDKSILAYYSATLTESQVRSDGKCRTKHWYSPVRSGCWSFPYGPAIEGRF